MLLEGEESLEAVALDGVFGDSSLLDAKLCELLMKSVVLLPGMAEVEVVEPCVVNALIDGLVSAFDGVDDGEHPISEKADVMPIGCAELCRAANLDGERQGLREQEREQGKRVTEA